MGTSSVQSKQSTDSSAGVIESYNPSTLERIGQVNITPKNEVAIVMEKAKVAQAAWGALSVSERCQKMVAFRDVLVRQTDEICLLLSQETGKPKTEALLTEVLVVIDLTSHFIKKAPTILSKKSISLHLLKNRASYLHYVPRGVVGIIAPWNFPFSIPLCEAVMALIAGNAVVLKPSEVTTMIALKAKELFDASGLPKDLFQVIPGFGETGAAMIESGIDFCIFTGSTGTGRKVGAACAERLIPHVLELGGKTPALVCADADIERTARALVWGAFANSGQVCVSIERAYVHKDIYDELLTAIKNEVKTLRQGNPMTGEVDIGSMTWHKQREIVSQHVEMAKKQGAEVFFEAETLPEPGLYYPPTILIHCNNEMDIMRREIFGPVLPIMKINSEEEGVTLCNDSSFGLMGYVFTKNVQKGKALAEQIRAGTVMVNDALITFAAPETPWGGIGFSGVGKTHGEDGLKELCHVRHVNYDRIRFKRELWWFPYREKFYQRVKKWIEHWYR